MVACLPDVLWVPGLIPLAGMLTEHEREILFEEENSQLLGFTLKALPKSANTPTLSLATLYYPCFEP